MSRIFCVCVSNGDVRVHYKINLSLLTHFHFHRPGIEHKLPLLSASVVQLIANVVNWVFLVPFRAFQIRNIVSEIGKDIVIIISWGGGSTSNKGVLKYVFYIVFYTICNSWIWHTLVRWTKHVHWYGCKGLSSLSLNQVQILWTCSAYHFYNQ